jgi:hypothetical protein
MSTCFLCGIELSGRRRTWCSKRCRDRWRGTVPSVTKACEGCAVEFTLPVGRLNAKKFCTVECAYKHRRMALLVGSENPNWRGGRALSYGVGWKALKAEIRSRDLVCRECGKTPEQNGRALDVHHLQPFRFSGDNSPENLVALCRRHHMRADDHGRSGSAKFLRPDVPKRPTKREIRRLKQLMREAERRALRREHQRDALKMKVEGASLREIARALGVSHETVSRWLKGYYRVQEPRTRYATSSKRGRPLGRPLLSCPPLRPGSSVGRARV